ncbi:MAG: hypothetical protein U9N07_09965 [Euryarchaeota archaeon]|nr:hypothetical protein [Euryarchaeota archaeon]
MNKKYLIIIVVLAIIIVYVGGLLFYYTAKPSVGGLTLAMSDENLSEVEVILKENLPTSFTVRVSSSSPRYYTVIPSSEFNSLKETLWNNESIEITAAKQENGDTYAFFHSCFGKIDLNYNITELQEPLNKYSLEAKEVNRIYVQFGDNVRYSEIEETLHLLEKESNVIRVFPDVLKR